MIEHGGEEGRGEEIGAISINQNHYRMSGDGDVIGERGQSGGESRKSTGERGESLVEKGVIRWRDGRV